MSALAENPFEDVARFGIDAHEDMLSLYEAQERAEEERRLAEIEARRLAEEAEREAQRQAEEAARLREQARGLAIAGLRELSKEKADKPLSVQDYQEYRKETNTSLPSITTLYRIFGSWPNALEAAGVLGETGVTRTDDEELLDSLRQCAADLGATAISSHQYDKWRQENRDAWEQSNQRVHPSSSVIRKWLGKWPDALVKAGLF